jgi:hypothetical protein
MVSIPCRQHRLYPIPFRMVTMDSGHGIVRHDDDDNNNIINGAVVGGATYP